jgi:ADP-heptose:LPS heptosyltransferase
LSHAVPTLSPAVERSLVIRAPNHLGDLVMALPALAAADPDAVVVPRALTSLVELAGYNAIPFETHLGTASLIRRRGFQRGVLLTPSFSSAVLLRLGNVKERRGTNTDHRGFLLTSRVDATLLEHTHRSGVYWLLCTGEMPQHELKPHLDIPKKLRDEFDELLRTQAPAHSSSQARTQTVGVFPGSNAPARRWAPERFAELARRLAESGQRVVVFGGPAERELTKQVAGDVAMDLGGQTTIPLLAAGLAACDLVVSNDSGPLHLAAAVGTRTISMWGAGDPARTGPPQGHVVIRDRRLPCLECVKNQCPRRGAGYILPDAYMECMNLIAVNDVITSIVQ